MTIPVAGTSTAATRAPVGTVTRGTTAPRRLRRVDRWLVAAHPRLLATPALLVVDLGFGARPFTTLELSARLRRINRGARVVGLEIEPERVAAAAPYRSPHWLTVNARGLASLTLAVDLAMAPSAVAARLPKALIHHNVSGQPIHRLLAALDQGWHRAAGLPAFSLRQRFAAAAAAVRADGWPVLDGPGRWRRGELTVKWDAVRPIGR